MPYESFVETVRSLKHPIYFALYSNESSNTDSQHEKKHWGWSVPDVGRKVNSFVPPGADILVEQGRPPVLSFYEDPYDISPRFDTFNI